MKDNKEEQRIESQEGKLFCKYKITEDGRKILIGKNCEILLDDLLQQVFNRKSSRS